MTVARDPELVTYEAEVIDLGFMVARRGETVCGIKQYRFDIPKAWTITYGPVVPGKGRQEPADDLVLRVYEGKSCRMLLRNVRSFRALNFQMWEKKDDAWVDTELSGVM